MSVYRVSSRVPRAICNDVRQIEKEAAKERRARRDRICLPVVHRERDVLISDEKINVATPPFVPVGDKFIDCSTPDIVTRRPEGNRKIRYCAVSRRRHTVAASLHVR